MEKRTQMARPTPPSLPPTCLAARAGLNMKMDFPSLLSRSPSTCLSFPPSTPFQRPPRTRRTNRFPYPARVNNVSWCGREKLARSTYVPESLCAMKKRRYSCARRVSRLLTWWRFVFDDVGEATVREIGAGREGEESRPICRARAKNWKAREGGSGKDRGGHRIWIPYRSFYSNHFSRGPVALAWFHGHARDTLESSRNGSFPRKKIAWADVTRDESWKYTSTIYLGFFLEKEN